MWKKITIEEKIQEMLDFGVYGFERKEDAEYLADVMRGLGFKIKVTKRRHEGGDGYLVKII